ncbi:FeoB small GTPase domain-containing protein [Leucothrix pacifica]|uniref:Fe(2+) transporter FeoB n=1 Tax=Leucothrix pacifica TaxID=1247513 RepID=A0A317C744_9GAMM|nr:FeoB small GTPase domain-containing protein [Leucothrix pacifica]PWQ94041.1 hypothetical protein DKW60_17540 [Leucothrix pacifica]
MTTQHCRKNTGGSCSASANYTQIALLGNPNAGKTTLFNQLTGARQRTGNWPGVTVERKTGLCCLQDEDLEIIDLPGTYSLDVSDTSTDEQIARNFVQENPDTLYLNILDATTLERGLYLSLQLRELGVPMIVLLNMMDVAKQRGLDIDIEALEAQLDCPVFAISLREDNALNKIIRPICRYSKPLQDGFVLSYDPQVESAVAQLQSANNSNRSQALEQLHLANDELSQSLNQKVESHCNEEVDFLLADARFDHATKMAKSVSKIRGKISKPHSDTLDKWILGRWTGVPIFLLMMYLLFFFSINLGGALIDFFDLSAQAIFVDPKILS